MCGVLWENRNTVLAEPRVSRMGHRAKKGKDPDFHTIGSLLSAHGHLTMLSANIRMYKSMKERKAIS
jgi:hypothetical protein